MPRLRARLLRRENHFDFFFFYNEWSFSSNEIESVFFLAVVKKSSSKNRKRILESFLFLVISNGTELGYMEEIGMEWNDLTWELVKRD